MPTTRTPKANKQRKDPESRDRQVLVRFTPTEYARLQACALEEGRTMGTMAMRAVVAWLDTFHPSRATLARVK